MGRNNSIKLVYSSKSSTINQPNEQERKQAEAILSELNSIKHVYPFNPRPGFDPELVREFFKKEKIPLYGNSWSYLTQAVNGSQFGDQFGYRYFDGESLAAIGYFKQPYSGGKSCHFHIVRPSGEWDLGKIEWLCSKLRDLSGTPVYLKKITTQQYRSWIGSRFKPIDAYPWHDRAFREDDTYPEVIIDLRNILNLLSPCSSDNELKRKKHLFERDWLSSLARLEYKVEHYSMAWLIVQHFFDQERISKKQISVPEDYKNMLKSLPSGKNGKDYFSSLLVVDNKPAAFFLADMIGPGTVGVYANITIPGPWRYLSEYLLINEFIVMAEAGIQIVNLGGSETEGLHRFKQKFRPFENKEMCWLVYD